MEALVHLGLRRAGFVRQRRCQGYSFHFRRLRRIVWGRVRLDTGLLVSVPLLVRHEEHGELRVFPARADRGRIDQPSSGEYYRGVSREDGIGESCMRTCANEVVAGARCSTLLPTMRLQDARQSARTRQIIKLEGLAVAIPWGFESPFPHHSTRGEPIIMANVLSESKVCPPL